MHIRSTVAAPAAVLASLTAIALSAERADAQSRLFSCPHAQVLELTVAGPDALKAEPVDGKAMTMKREAANPLRFVNGKHVVTLSQDQGTARLEVPNKGAVECIFGTRNVAPLIPVRGARASTCGPGFHPAPQTDRCDPDPGTNPNAQPRRTGTADGVFPMTGQSLGGIMRAAPSMESPKLRSLAAGADIRLLERADRMDGYDWFKIEAAGQSGYQWGGILCSEQAIRGAFQQCEP